MFQREILSAEGKGKKKSPNGDTKQPKIPKSTENKGSVASCGSTEVKDQFINCTSIICLKNILEPILLTSSGVYQRLLNQKFLSNLREAEYVGLTA